MACGDLRGRSRRPFDRPLRLFHLQARGDSLAQVARSPLGSGSDSLEAVRAHEAVVSAALHPDPRRLRLEEVDLAKPRAWDGCAQQFADTAKRCFGSAWAWLAAEQRSGRLSVLSMEDARNPLRRALGPLRKLDVRGHAYYFDYPNGTRYLDNFLEQRLDWGFVENNRWVDVADTTGPASRGEADRRYRRAASESAASKSLDQGAPTIMNEIILWALYGLLVGVVAKLVMPGRDPGGVIVTIGLGIVGAVLGGWLDDAVGLSRGRAFVEFILAVIGGVVTLAAFRALGGRRRRWRWR
jgi:uncharacterized membrane protein YeaQ/YmgE (transglycosylase-associated protein family)